MDLENNEIAGENVMPLNNCETVIENHTKQQAIKLSVAGVICAFASLVFFIIALIVVAFVDHRFVALMSRLLPFFGLAAALVLVLVATITAKKKINAYLITAIVFCALVLVSAVIVFVSWYGLFLFYLLFTLNIIFTILTVLFIGLSADRVVNRE